MSSQTEIAAVLAGLLMGAWGVQARNVAGSVRGVIQDAQGAVVPGAKVTLTNVAHS